MTIKKRLIGCITAAMALGGVSINAFANTKALKAQRKPKIPKIPKTRTDYEALHAAELKRRRKAETYLRNQHKQEA